MDGVGRSEREGNNDILYVFIPLGVSLVLASPFTYLFTGGEPLVGLGTLVAASLSLGFGVQAARRRRALSPSAPQDKERELLSAVRDGGSVTPVEAAMETSLTVREADAMLSELANDGHLLISSEGGALRYSLPTRNRVVGEIG